MHRLRRLRSGLPGFGNLRPRRPAGKVEGLRREERQVFWEIGCQRSALSLALSLQFAAFSLLLNQRNPSRCHSEHAQRERTCCLPAVSAGHAKSRACPEPVEGFLAGLGMTSFFVAEG